MYKFDFGTAGSLLLGKACKAAEGVRAASAVVGAFPAGIAGRRVVIIDHPPTEGLVPLIEGLMKDGAEVHLRDHHADADRDGTTVARVRELLGERRAAAIFASQLAFHRRRHGRAATLLLRALAAAASAPA